jgi:2-succinyl-6-hydroxy-2,4-cyclohexadiene-1-carboxylate synthase
MKQHLNTKLISVNGVYLGVVERSERASDEPPLVLLHGFTGSAASWGRLLYTLPGRRLIALDLLGHGASDAPEDAGRYTIEHGQDDMIAALRQTGIAEGEAVLLGYSLGGRIALYSAFSGFFKALILESSSPGLADSRDREQRAASDEALAERIEQEGVASFVDYWERIPLFASQRNLPAATRSALHAQRLLNQAPGLANSLRGVGTGAQPALHEQLSQLDLPALLITGALDAKFCDIARQMAQHLPHAELYIVPDAGHTVHLERPDIFVNLVKQFVKGATQS